MAEPPICIYCTATVSDKNSWDTFTKRCFFPSRAPLVPLKVVYRGSVTKSCTPTLRGQGDPRVSQPFWLRLCFRGILAMWLLVGSGGGKSLGRWYTFRSHFFGKNIRDFTDRKREDNQYGKEVFLSLITTFQGIKKVLYVLGLKSEQRMSQNWAH